MANLFISDHRRPRPPVTPGATSALLTFKVIGRRSLALPNATRSGIQPLLLADFKCRGW